MWGAFASERCRVTAKVCFNILLRLEKQEYMYFPIEIFHEMGRGAGGRRGVGVEGKTHQRGGVGTPERHGVLIEFMNV